MDLVRRIVLGVLLLAATHPASAQEAGALAESVGLQVLPVPEDLRAHLPTLPPDQGFMVALVTPGSRAEGMGIRQHDVLIALGKRAFRTDADLLKALAGADPVKREPLHIIRGGFPKVLAPNGIASDEGGENTSYAPAKSLFKPGAPPAVGLELKPGQGGALEVNLFYRDSANAMQRKSLRGTLESIERQVNAMARQGQIATNTHDLLGVALQRLRTRNDTGTAARKVPGQESAAPAQP